MAITTETRMKVVPPAKVHGDSGVTAIKPDVDQSVEGKGASLIEHAPRQCSLEAGARS